MNILKLLRDVFARVKAISTLLRSTIRNATASRPMPDAGTPSPQTFASPLESYPTRSAEVVDPTHSSENAEHACNAAGESSNLASTSSHGVVEPHSLEGMGPTGEFPLPLGTPPPAAIVSETDQHAISDHSPPVTTAVERRRSVKRRRRPRKPYTLQLDFSQYPEISDNEVGEFRRCSELGTLDTVVDLTALRLDALLLRALNGVRLIGELPISDTAFRQIAEVMRDAYLIRGRPNISKIPPALFITSMVFCARYSEEEVRNFWTPYARLVWELPEASLTFQNRCRKHFEACRKYLAQWFGFAFPTVEGQDGGVVRPVYYHAVIPYYLEDSFAKWLAQNLEVLHALSTNYGSDALPLLLADEPSLNQVPPALRSFILQETTSAKAAVLISLLCEAAGLYLSGEEDVPDLIASPIERALWHKVQQELDDRVERESRRRGPQPKLTWGWSLEDEVLQLRLAHVSGSGPSLPDLCVWAEQGETALSRSEIYQILDGYLWRRRDAWLLDEILLSGGPIDGQISVLSEDHDDDLPDILFQANVPPLPNGPVVFAQKSRQDWATFVDSRRVTAGEWLISVTGGIKLWDRDGNPIAPQQPVNLPNLFRNQCGHVAAGWYSLSLPLTVTQDDEPLLTIEATMEQIGMPVLEGPYLLPNLLSRIPPVFSGLPLTLRIPGMTNDLLSHTTLSIRSAVSHALFRLDELRTDGVLSIPADGECTIALDDLFPHEAGIYTVHLRRGLRSLLDEPVQFAFLPDVAITGPHSGQLYTPANLPRAKVAGASVGQITVVRGRTHVSLTDDAIEITWHDLRSPECSLRLEINGQSFPLAWPIRRTYAWVDTLADDGTLRAKDRDAATIHIRGFRYQQVFWRVGGDSEREFRLNAEGAKDIELSRDQLIEMIEARRETRVFVEIVADGTSWKLFEYVRKPDVTVQQVAYDSDTHQLVLECKVGQVCQGDFRLQVLNADAPVDEPEFIADFESFKTTLVFDCTDCALPPGQYELQILSGGTLVDVAPGIACFNVEGAVEFPITSSSTTDVLGLLSLPGASYSGLDLGNLDVTLASIVRELAEINRPDEWIARHGLLPAWAVTIKPLRLRTREHYIELTAYPELASHKGRAGKGSVDLKLDDGSLARVYATWELMQKAENTLYTSQLKVMIPTFEVVTPFCELDEYDLWPAYQCSICGKLVGSRSGTYFQLSPSTQVVHRHARNFPPKKHPFRDIVYSYDLHVAARLGSGDDLVYAYPPFDMISTRSGDTERESTPISPQVYQRALEECDQDDRRHQLKRLAQMLEWELSFQKLHKYRADTMGRAMFAAAYRLIDALAEAKSSLEPWGGLERNVVMLALILRSRAVYPSVYDAFRSNAALADRDFESALSLTLDTCPLLLKWALTWIELFRVHAIS